MIKNSPKKIGDTFTDLLDGEGSLSRPFLLYSQLHNLLLDLSFVSISNIDLDHLQALS